MKALRSTYRSSLLAAVVLALGVVFPLGCQTGQAERQASAVAQHGIERVEWDAPEVERLTSKLSKEMSALRQSVRLDPTMQERLRVQSNAALRLRDILRVLEVSARQLATRVASGGGLEETMGIAKKIGSLLRSGEVQARSMMLTQPTLDVVEQARGTLRALGPFYGANLNVPEAPA